MVIDGHAHAFGDYIDVQSIIKTLDENKADAVVLCPGKLKKRNTVPNLNLNKTDHEYLFPLNKIIRFVASIKGISKHIDKGNEYVYKLVKENPKRIFQYYWVNPYGKNAIEKMQKRYLSWQFKGIKLNQCWNKFNLKDEKLHDISKWAGENGLPIFIHIATKKDARDFVDLANSHPQTNYIVAHMIGIDVFVHYYFKYKNVYFDISLSNLYPLKRLLIAISEYGAERILMGTDTPIGNGNLKQSISFVKKLPIPNNQKALILGENLKKLLKIDPYTNLSPANS